MKRFLRFISMALCCVMLSACGLAFGAEQAEGDEGQFDILADSSDIIGVEESGEGDTKFMGMQFYRGEPVQIWAEQIEIGDGRMSAALYLHRQGEKEILFSKLTTERDSFPLRGILDEAGAFYGIKGREIVKYGPEGEKVYSVSAKGTVTDVCVFSEDQLILLVRNAESSRPEIVLMEAASGECRDLKLSEDLYFTSFVGTDGGMLYVLDRDGLWEIDEKEGKRSNVLSFAQTSYAFTASLVSDRDMEAFRVTEDGTIELLWADAQGQGSIERLEKMKVREDKTVITLRGVRFLDTWMKERVVDFNQSNEKYYVVIEECEDLTYAEDYITQTGVELATGKGPDILYKTDILGEAAYSLIQKGIAADLAPFMEQSGIREEDYFPAAFDCLRSGNGIYGVNVKLSTGGYAMKESVIGNCRDLGAESIIDALLTYEGKAVYRKGVGSQEMLREFLEGSESMWGMLDKEAGECDFSKGFFTKLLRAAKRYGDDGRNSYEELSERRDCSRIYFFENDTQLAGRGLIPSGVLFDDGCHGMVDDKFVLMINANSPNREGAWEFLEFLLSEEVQSDMDFKSLLPVNRAAFGRFVEREIAEGAVVVTQKANGSVHKTTKGSEDLTEEQAAEIQAYLEAARSLPIQNRPILDIICKEAADYFQDVKSEEEVIQVIENRVRLYLRENR